MIALLMTILCSSSIALIMKHNSQRKGQDLILLAGNYLVAALISGTRFAIWGEGYSLGSGLFGAGLAFFFVFTFFAFARSVTNAGTALATVSSRLSVFLPILLSILIFGEQPNEYQLLGFVFVLLTIILFYKSLMGKGAGNYGRGGLLWIVALFLGIGINDFAFKIYEQTFPRAEQAFFLFMIFTCSFIYTIAVVLLKRGQIDRPSFVRGMALGIPNIFSSVFLLYALTTLAAFIVYPVINVGIILLTTVAALLIWGERPDKYGIWALIIGAMSIVLLSL